MSELKKFLKIHKPKCTNCESQEDYYYAGLREGMLWALDMIGRECTIHYGNNFITEEEYDFIYNLLKKEIKEVKDES